MHFCLLARYVVTLTSLIIIAMAEQLCVGMGALLARFTDFTTHLITYIYCYHYWISMSIFDLHIFQVLVQGTYNNLWKNSCNDITVRSNLGVSLKVTIRRHLVDEMGFYGLTQTPSKFVF